MRRAPASCARLGDRALAAHGPRLAGAGRLRGVLAGGIPRPGPLLAAVPAPLPRAAHLGALVDRAGTALDFPAAYAIRFFDNHGMLGFGRFRWRTVAGGSRRYVTRSPERLGDRLHLGRGVRSIRRGADGVELRPEGGEVHRFDGVVVATHADQALALLEDPSRTSSACSAPSRTRENETVLHTDARFLPRGVHGPARSWNYRLDAIDDGRPTMTYHLNRLQGSRRSATTASR